MKAVPSTAKVLAIALLLGGCASPMQINPEFRNCTNACAKRQDACMVNASNAGEVGKCNAAQQSCVAGCEQKYPRYLPQ